MTTHSKSRIPSSRKRLAQQMQWLIVFHPLTDISTQQQCDGLKGLNIKRGASPIVVFFFILEQILLQRFIDDRAFSLLATKGGVRDVAVASSVIFATMNSITDVVK